MGTERALANWPGRIKAQTVDGLVHAVDLYPTLAAVAGASTAKCKPLDGLNIWDTIAEGKASPRSEIVYNIEPFRGAVPARRLETHLAYNASVKRRPL